MTRNTGLRVVADSIGKLATIGLFAVMARHFGPDGFGDFIFVVSLGLLVTMLAGFGSDELLPRMIATGEADTSRILSTALVLKLVGGTAAFALALVVGLIGGYEGQVVFALGLIAASALVDLLATSIYAVFQGLHDLAPQAGSRTLQLTLRAAVGVMVILLGGGIVAVALVYLAASLVTCAYASRLLIVRVSPRWLRPTRSDVKALATTSLPIAVALLINVGILGVDTVILSQMEGSGAVGFFGGAQRLVESTVFIGAAFAAALLPVLAAAASEGGSALASVYESGCKVIVTLLLPISTGFLLFAEPITTTLYGEGFEPAAAAVRIMSATVVLVGLSTLSLYVLIARNRQWATPWVAGFSLVLNVALVFVLVPVISFNGTAVAILAAELIYVLVITALALRESGRLSVGRVMVGPLGGVGAMGLVVLAGGTGAITIVLAFGMYALTWLVLERRFYPQDLALIVGLLRGAAVRFSGSRVAESRTG